MTIQVTGRNGSTYPATHVSGNLYIVGKFIVAVEDGHCKATICKATKANIKSHS